MSRWTYLGTSELAAIGGMRGGEARRLIIEVTGVDLYGRPQRVTAGQVEDYLREHDEAVPALLLALCADKREYPRWLVDLTHEWRQACKRLKGNRQGPMPRRPMMADAQTLDEAYEIAQVFPELEIRGQLDAGELPPEYKMRDHWHLGEHDGEGPEREG